MVPLNQALPPLAVISHVSAIDQNTSSGTGANNLGGQHLGKGEGRQFQHGQEMAAKVVATDGQGRYTLDAGGQRIEVQSQSPLQIGQQFNVLVQESENGLLLALKSPDISQFLTRSLATGGSSQALGMIFGQGIAAQARGGETFFPPASTALTGTSPNSSTGSSTSTAKASFDILPTPAVAGKMSELQRQFVLASGSPQTAGSGNIQAGNAVQLFTTEIGRQITPLLSQGRIVEAMDQLAAGLRSIAPFFPPQPTGGLPQGLNAQQQELYHALSSLYQAEKGRAGAEEGEAALRRVVQQLQSQLTPALAMPGRDIAGPPQNPQAMLAALNGNLFGIQNLIQLPVMFQNQPPGASVFQGGIEGMFALQLSLAGTSSSAMAGMEESSRHSGMILQQLIGGLGLDMEKLLAQGDIDGASKGLKFQLLRQVQEAQSNVQGEMQQALATGEGGEESGLLRQIGESHQALQSLNFLQVLQANLDKQGMLILPLPLPFLEQGYMLMEEHGKEGEKKDGGEDASRFSVLMRLSSLGNVRVDFLQTKEDIYIRFHTESNEISQLFRQFQQELRTGLHPLKVQGLSYASEPAGDPLAVLLQKCEGEGTTSLFRARV